MELEYANALSGAVINSKATDESFPAALAELENQLDRLVGVISSLEDRTAAVSVPSGSVTDDKPGLISGVSDRGKRMWENADRLRASINRLERISNNLDV